jgi:hypothetical protein
MLCLVRPGFAKLGHVRTRKSRCHVRPGEVRLGEFRTRQVMSGNVRRG